MEETAEDILKRYAQTKALKEEPIRELKSMEDLEGWSYIPQHERLLLTQLFFLAEEFELPIIYHLIIIPHLKFGLSVDGKARIQFEKAHTGILDQLKPVLAGFNMGQDERNPIKRDKQ